jgi:hypothetical protein
MCPVQCVVALRSPSAGSHDRRAGPCQSRMLPARLCFDLTDPSVARSTAPSKETPYARTDRSTGWMAEGDLPAEVTNRVSPGAREIPLVQTSESVPTRAALPSSAEDISDSWRRCMAEYRVNPKSRSAPNVITNCCDVSQSGSVARLRKTRTRRKMASNLGMKIRSKNETTGVKSGEN